MCHDVPTRDARDAPRRAFHKPVDPAEAARTNRSVRAIGLVAVDPRITAIDGMSDFVFRGSGDRAGKPDRILVGRKGATGLMVCQLRADSGVDRRVRMFELAVGTSD